MTAKKNNTPTKPGALALRFTLTISSSCSCGDEHLDDLELGPAVRTCTRCGQLTIIGLTQHYPTIDALVEGAHSLSKEM